MPSLRSSVYNERSLSAFESSPPSFLFFFFLFFAARACAPHAGGTLARIGEESVPVSLSIEENKLYLSFAVGRFFVLRSLPLPSFSFFFPFPLRASVAADVSWGSSAWRVDGPPQEISIRNARDSLALLLSPFSSLGAICVARHKPPATASFFAKQKGKGLHGYAFHFPPPPPSFFPFSPFFFSDCGPDGRAVLEGLLRWRSRSCSPSR